MFWNKELADMDRSSHQPPDFAIFTGKHLCWSHFLIQLKAFRLHLHQKETPPTQISSRKYYEIFKSTYFEKHLRTAAPEWRKINQRKERQSWTIYDSFKATKNTESKTSYEQEKIITGPPVSSFIFEIKIVICNITNLLFWVLWICPAMTTKNDGVSL